MRRASSIQVSLFPFLAVLLCAMGALIVLLVVLSNQVRSNTLEAMARKRAGAARIVGPAPEPKPDSPPSTPPRPVVALRDPNADLRAKQARLHESREELASQLDQLQATIASRTAKREKLTKQLRDARTARDADTSRLEARKAELSDAQAKIAALAGHVAAASQELQQAKGALATASAKLQIIPYDGRSGTARKPILIECTMDSLRFIPSGITLTPDQVDGYTPEYNPLLAGAAALRTYWMVHADSQAEEQPYVLLLVHDRGIIAYYVARSLLKSLGANTGYVLLTDEMEIAQPEVVPAARAACQKAIQEALAVQPAIDALTSEKSDFLHGRFQVNPQSHDPTISEEQDGGLYGNLYPSQHPRSGSQAIQFADRGPGSAAARGVSPGMRRGFLGEGRLGSSHRPGSENDVKSGGDDPPPGSRQGESSTTRFGRGGDEDAGGDHRGMPTTGPHGPGGNSRPGSRPPMQPGGVSVPVPEKIGKFAPQISVGVGGQPQGAAEGPTPGARKKPQSTKAAPGSWLVPRTSSPERSSEDRHWGASAPTAIISLEHELPVFLSSDVIQIGNQPALLVGPGGLNNVILEDVVRAISREAKSWGEPPENFYWSPHVNVTLTPDSEILFTRLKAALENAGLRVSDHIALEEQVPLSVKLREESDATASP